MAMRLRLTMREADEERMRRRRRRSSNNRSNLHNNNNNFNSYFGQSCHQLQMNDSNLIRLNLDCTRPRNRNWRPTTTTAATTARRRRNDVNSRTYNDINFLFASGHDDDEHLQFIRSIPTYTPSMNSKAGMNLLTNSLKGNEYLIELDLDNNRIGDDGIEILSNALPFCSSLQQIHLLNNNIGPKGASALSKVLSSKPCSVTHLFLGNNKIGTEGAIEFRDMFVSIYHQQNSSNFVEVDEEETKGDDTEKAQTTLVTCNEDIGKNSSNENEQQTATVTTTKTTALKSLHLSYNEIGNDGAIALLECLSTTTKNCTSSSNSETTTTSSVVVDVSLETLYLDNNEISDKGANRIATLVKDLHPNVKTLWLGGNKKITNDGEQLIVNYGLKYNYNLTFLNLVGYCGEHNNTKALHVQIKNDIDLYLKLNKNGRRLLQYDKNDAVYNYLWTFILSKKREASRSLIYYYLCENPDLCEHVTTNNN